MTKSHDEIESKGINISLFSDTNSENKADFISLTDIARYQNPDAPKDIIKNWMRNRGTLEFLGVWEKMNNPDFLTNKFESLTNSSGSNTFVMSPGKWIEETHATGIAVQRGRYGGTYAQTDIAFEFASWVSPEFKLYLIQDYQALKKRQNDPQRLEWNAKRLLAKVNNRIQTDAIKDYLIPPTLSKKEAGYKYADEADRLYMALFGTTSKKWKISHPNLKGNIRDYATVDQLLILSNLESMNAEFILEGLDDLTRTVRLNEIALRQMKSLSNETSTSQLKKLKDLDSE